MAYRPKKKQDVANIAIKMFLQIIGEQYDENRRNFLSEKLNLIAGPLKFNDEQETYMLNYFNNECCYCNYKFQGDDYHVEHMIPINAKYNGLHAWGNVALACSRCNAKKHGNLSWERFLSKNFIDKKINRSQFKIKRKLLKAYSALYGKPQHTTNAKILYNEVSEYISTVVEARGKMVIENLSHSQSFEDRVPTLNSEAKSARRVTLPEGWNCHRLMESLPRLYSELPLKKKKKKIIWKTRAER